MIRIDRKVARAALKLTTRYDDLLYYETGNALHLTDDSFDISKSITVSVNDDDIPYALSRLDESGFIKIQVRMLGGGVLFSIEPKLRHKYAFLMDSFSKRFSVGFISGFATATAAFLFSKAIPSLYAGILKLLSHQ